MNAPKESSQDTWQDMVITLNVMLIVLVTSSVGLGMSAIKLAEGLQHLTEHSTLHMLEATHPQ